MGKRLTKRELTKALAELSQYLRDESRKREELVRGARRSDLAFERGLHGGTSNGFALSADWIDEILAAAL